MKVNLRRYAKGTPQEPYADRLRRLDDAEQLRAIKTPARPSLLRRFAVWLETPTGDAVGSTVLTLVAIVVFVALLILGAPAK